MKERYKPSIRILTIMLLDLLLITVCCGAAFLVRFEFSFNEIPSEYKTLLWRFLPLQSVITLAIFWMRKMYHCIWRAVSVYDVANMILSVIMGFAASYLIGCAVELRLPNSVAFIDLLCLLSTQVGMRCFLRFYSVFIQALEQRQVGGERIMIIGGGEAGRLLLHEIQSSRKGLGKVCSVIDDNPAKWGKQMNGVPVCGGREKIGEVARKEKITQIIFAIPTATPSQKREILELCQKTGCKIKTLPGLYQFINGEVSLADVKDVQVEDLLGRDPVQLDTKAIKNFLRDRIILVTGGGGSIGSELCRQIARYRPRQIVILDIYENNAYDIQQELLRQYPWLNLCVEIASIRDKEKTYALFEHYRPEIVFHAAAHKHVPLMENCPEEAIKNNVFGTHHVVRAAEKYGVKKFVMISTDKAVNPTNVMGATKRFCEMIIQSRCRSTTEFCAVRFGNVLGSNGSVVPLFKRQIEQGGPVTLTDKRIIRYFMTIFEAAQLVLEAGAMATRGQIFVLDMGEPVKILTLAENLIRLSGLEPYTDIEIREVGLRPGEKLYEELLTKSDTLVRTANDKLFVEQQEHISPEWIMAGLQQLDKTVSEAGTKEELIAIMKQLVPTYQEAEKVNTIALESSGKAEVHAADLCGSEENSRELRCEKTVLM